MSDSATPAASPAPLTADEYDDLYLRIEADAEGHGREMVRRAYDAGRSVASPAQPVDEAVSFIRTITEEMVLAGLPGGDREIVLKNLRKVLAERKAPVDDEVAVMVERLRQFAADNRNYIACERAADMLTRLATPAADTPIPMILHCPACHTQHIDAPDPATGWTNPPHRSHECQACGHIWRPADVATTGAQAISTKGTRDNPPAADSGLREALRELVECYDASLVSGEFGERWRPAWAAARAALAGTTTQSAATPSHSTSGLSQESADGSAADP